MVGVGAQRFRLQQAAQRVMDARHLVRLAGVVGEEAASVRGQVLDQAAAEVEVDHLQAAADAQHRQTARQGQVEQGPLNHVALR